MAKNKTAPTDVGVFDFINTFADTEQKKKDSFELIKLMQKITGFEPYMWGPSIVGFGNYHYKYKSGHEGDAPLVGFSPRKAAISLYVFTGMKDHEYLLEGLGKFTMGKVCIYVKKISDINLQKLETLISESVKYLQANYQIN